MTAVPTGSRDGIDCAMATRPRRRLQAVFAVLMLLQGLAVIGAALMLHSINLPLSPVRIEEQVMIGAGVLLALCALPCYRLPPQWSLSLAVGTLIATLVFALGYRPVRHGDYSVLLGMRTWQSATEWTENGTTSDPVTGWKGLPNSAARQHDREFLVTYHTDADGWRRLPVPAGAPIGTAWFIGCSFTFGAAVEDEEVYVHRLAKAWPQVRVRNFSYSGWGTTNAYLILKDRLAQAEKPDVIVYGLISHHMKRNYLRRSWFGAVRAATIPHFELENGALAWKGFTENYTTLLPDSPALDEKEFKLTVALIRAMAEASRERGVPFVLLVLHNDVQALVEAVRGTPNLHVLDVSKLSTSYYAHDGHPTPVWHRTVANAIATEPLLAKISGVAALHAPGVIGEPAMARWRLSRSPDLGDRSIATMRYPGDDSAVLRVEQSGDVVADPWKLYMQRIGYDIVNGRSYMLEMRVRTSLPRTLQYLVSRSGPPWGNLGIEKRLAANGAWQTVRETFTASGTDHAAQIMLLVGGARGAVELDGEPVLRELSAAELQAKLAPDHEAEGERQLKKREMEQKLQSFTPAGLGPAG